MIPRVSPPIDNRDSIELLKEFLNRRLGYVPQWNPSPISAGAAMGPIFSRFLYAVTQRLNQAPAKTKLAALDLLGLRLIPPQPARAPIAFKLNKDAADSSAPAGTRIAAPPPPGSSRQVVFETEQDTGVASASLAQVVSLWPGRDQYLDHTAALAAAKPITFFDSLALVQTEHVLYFAHSSLLAFAGTAHLAVTFDLSQGSSSPLDVIWEFWDGTAWRGFIAGQISCLDAVQAGHDGTGGLTADGAVHLDVEGAQTAPTIVNKVSSSWIRARLSQPLPPDPGVQLPIVNSVDVRTLIDRHMEISVAVVFNAVLSTPQSTVAVSDEAGQPIGTAQSPVTVSIVQVSDSPAVPTNVSIDSNTATAADITFTPGYTYQFTVAYLGLTGTAFVPFQLESAGADSAVSLTVTFKVEGLLPDKALADGKTLDLTKAFFPLGSNPHLGSTFYFKQNEILSKPSAVVQIYLDPAIAANYSDPGKPISHTVNWEYWNGWDWALLVQSMVSGSATSYTFSKDFTANEIVEFIVPNDLRPTKVNNDDGLWLRVRLVAGGYALHETITIPNVGTVNYLQPLPPSVAVFRMGYSWMRGPFPFETVFTYNDFQYQDHSDDARLPGRSFAPFTTVAEVTPEVYFGYDKQLPVNNFGQYMDVQEVPGAPANPAIIWEYWNGAGWRETLVEDGTRNLQLPGILNFIPSADSRALARFGQPLHWFRGRLKEDQPPPQTAINNIYINTVWASQRETFANTPLGASTGVPNQILQFTQIPVLPGQIIEVRELSGARANTEWRTIVLDETKGDAAAVGKLEAALAAEGTQTDVLLETIRLTRDKTKRVTGVWVQWREQQSFDASTSVSRHYVLDHASGRVFFGSGDAGMIPRAGAAIQALTFQTGGGLAGNVRASTITQLLGSVSGVQSVSNPRAAEGGADGETLDAFSERAPMTIRNRGRALILADYETMAHEASAGLGFARAIPSRDPEGRTVPGWITLIIIPQSLDAQPVPSFGLREAVRLYLEARTPANVAVNRSINVIGPDYLPVDVTATLAPNDPSQLAKVEQAVLAALAEFFHPLRGGPGGLGWDLGRSVYASDVVSVLGDVAGVNYVEELALFVNGVLQGEQVEVPAERIVVAGQLKVSLVLPVMS